MPIFNLIGALAKLAFSIGQVTVGVVMMVVEAFMPRPPAPATKDLQPTEVVNTLAALQDHLQVQAPVLQAISHMRTEMEQALNEVVRSWIVSRKGDLISLVPHQPTN